MEAWSRLAPAELEAAMARLQDEEDRASRVLEEDSLYQMDVSLRPQQSGAVRVFWRDVHVQPVRRAGTDSASQRVIPSASNVTTTTTSTTSHNNDNHTYNANHDSVTEARRDINLSEAESMKTVHSWNMWYTVTLDGRPVRAFESTRVLVLPTEEMALCCAHEYAAQRNHLNKLLMPLTDLCSGAMHVTPQAIAPRIDYLLSFYRNDNVYFRAAPIASAQDALLEPVVSWFTQAFGVPVPRIVGIGHPRLTPHAVQRVREALLAMELNTYQVIALCVAAQFMSSLILPLALFHEQIDLTTALRINRAEESHNTEQAGVVAGYHDIREADAVVKICACATAWRLLRHVPLSMCAEGPLNANRTAVEEAEAV